MYMFGTAKELVAAIEALLATADVWIKLKEGAVKPKAKDLIITAAYKKPISFVGRNAESINMLGAKLMDIDIVFPPEVRAKNALQEGV
jgi:hypothetical protein